MFHNFEIIFKYLKQTTKQEGVTFEIITMKFINLSSSYFTLKKIRIKISFICFIRQEIKYIGNFKHVDRNISWLAIFHFYSIFPEREKFTFAVRETAVYRGARLRVNP